ncbi:5687_t:CDS:1, partial [Gigaspora rosea]
NSKQKLDIYYNPWTDLNFDQNNQQFVSDTLLIEENLLTEQEVLQLEYLQPHNAKNINNTQDL